MTLKKIISGCQTGADLGALRAARELDLLTGGWMPKGYRTDEGPRPDLAERFDLLEHSSALYPGRTLTNVMASDGTLIFGNSYSPGCRLTKRCCIEQQRPYIIISWPKISRADPISHFLCWLDSNNIEVLNVAGNRERTNPGIEKAAKNFLLAAITELKAKET
jgi:Circularly permutated YpsA SLOG family